MKKITSIISLVLICLTLFAGCTKKPPKTSPVLPSPTPSVMPTERVSEPPAVNESDALRPSEEPAVTTPEA